ncbi:hypothetical protein PVAP13_6NG030583 [Panicum virgatum]|uniref:Uncharacterized protein n=1 Tax=Panicum virgatum TaxID=38727 RepID=A0A8T0QTW5_PANVG|nr:hypothetical protein PVAP13_6NG030583 [Panicum virgatum]
MEREGGGGTWTRAGLHGRGHRRPPAPCGSGRRRRGPARRRPETEEGCAAAMSSWSVTWSLEEAQTWGRPERRRRRRSMKAGRRPCKLAVRRSRGRSALGAPQLGDGRRRARGGSGHRIWPALSSAIADAPWASVSAGGQAGERIRPGELGSAPSMGVALVAAGEEGGGGGGSGCGRSQASSPAARGLRGRQREEAWGRRAVERGGQGWMGKEKRGEKKSENE